MKQINFRRKLKLLVKDFQRANGSYTKEDSIVKDFFARNGLFCPTTSYINDLLKSKVRGGALARVCRTALKNDSYVDIRDVFRKGSITDLHLIPFCQIKVERHYFYQDMTFLQKTFRDGTSETRFLHESPKIVVNYRN